MSSDKPKTAMNVVTFVLLAILVLAGVIYLVAFEEAEHSGIAEKRALDAMLIEQVIENEPGKSSPAAADQAQTP
jgi:hypothetical protein